MAKVYEGLRSKMERENAVIVSLMLHIICWFLIGIFLGAAAAFLSGRENLAVSYSITAGSCMALTLGYVWGYIKLVKIAY